MTRLLLWGGVAVVVVGLACFYPLGEQPLIGHVAEVYKSPLVQKKVAALNNGVDKRTHEIGASAQHWWQKATEQEASPKKRPHHAPMSRVEPPSRQEASRDEDAPKAARVQSVEPPKPPAPVVSKAPAAVSDKPAPTEPPHDQLTDQDRDGLNKLLANKLHGSR